MSFFNDTTTAARAFCAISNYYKIERLKKAINDQRGY